MVTGSVRAPKEMEQYYGLLRVESTNGESPRTWLALAKEFEKLTPIFPDDKFKLVEPRRKISPRRLSIWFRPLAKANAA